MTGSSMKSRSHMRKKRFRMRTRQASPKSSHAGPKISEDVPPGRRALAQMLIILYQHLGGRLKEVAEALAPRGYKKNVSDLSRYWSGQRVPQQGFVIALHQTAAERAGGEGKLGISRDDVLEVYAAAEQRPCQVCPDLHHRIRRLRSRHRRLMRANRHLLESRAGLEAELADARKETAPLPVPPSRGDRQQSAYDVAAATQIAAMAERFDSQERPGNVVAMLRQAAEVLTPLESAASLAVLRQEHRDQVADTLIQIYGRDQPEKQVIQAALELHEYGMPADAGAMLRAAAH
ncbi:hypothetical protein [Streptomyces antimycoticus]|uniref:hypothetical protein n=1 Tax=Streptomyces antimycoticus TaxID=68175 RepID=UPI0033E08776|nr:hypothetical protein OG751_25870 [Streptomyces antimycoticus]